MTLPIPDRESWDDHMDRMAADWLLNVHNLPANYVPGPELFRSVCRYARAWVVTQLVPENLL